ncbi:MAG: hypothetical protein GEV28_20145 [Actinophytocola sp.]|uniref:hypothetical protein n=1 Tax=Actinophytocola sp. TaxID=1872138 RepID=UPI001329418D|nr:hypothetical protein [Actinophytocola sp.]MPZ82583.1 hypothetical protein [Actinophytocola sp.]
MFAVIAAVIFALALILDLADATIGTTIDGATLLTAGLLCMALHLAGTGVNARGRGVSWRRKR